MSGGAGLANILAGICGQFPPGDPDIDALIYWDDSANKFNYATLGAGISIIDGVITVDSGGGNWGDIGGTLSDQVDLQNALDLKYDASNPDNYISDFTGFTTDDLAEGSSNLYYDDVLVDARIAAQKGAANGIAPLGSDSKINVSYLPAAVLGAAQYQGAWDAAANSPTLASSAGTKGFYYVVDTAGATNLDGITDWKVGDWAIYNGTAWQKIDNTDAVISVNGQIGIVDLDADDISDAATTKKFTTAADITKLAGIAAGATANQTDAFLLDRANHTGSQLVSTISNFNDGRTLTRINMTANTVISTLPAIYTAAQQVGTTNLTLSFASVAATIPNTWFYVGNSSGNNFNIVLTPPPGRAFNLQNISGGPANSTIFPGEAYLIQIQTVSIPFIAGTKVPLAQLGGIRFQNEVTNLNGTQTISNTSTTHIYTGTTPKQWNLPAISTAGNVGLFVIFKNRGTANLTIGVAGGGAEIYDSTTITSVTLVPGASYMFFNDGTYWNLISRFPTGVYNEIPSGLVNSINTVYTTANNFATGSTRVYFNGLRQMLGVDYTETAANGFTFTMPPGVGGKLFVDYQQ